MYNAYDERFFQFDFFDIYNHPLPFVGGVVTKKPEQCTGLKDKKGNLIYEGDILQDRNGIKAEVVWSYSHACFGIDEGCGEVIEFGECLCLCPMSCEVIGNIHENPELLGEKQ